MTAPIGNTVLSMASAVRAILRKADWRESGVVIRLASKCQTLTVFRSPLPLHQIPRQLLQSLRLVTETLQLRERRAYQRRRLAHGFINPEQRRVSDFLRGSVFARALAQLLRGLRHIEHVIHNLKRQPHGLTKRA